MRLDLAQRAIVDQLIAECHAEATNPDGSITSAKAASLLVAKLHHLEGSGADWVGRLIDSFAIAGAARACSGWRRTHRTTSATKKGLRVSLPSFAGIKQKDQAGQSEWVQLPLAAMGVDHLKAHVEKLGRTRNTLSVELAVLTALIEAMEADPSLATVADALHKAAA